jgi:hypothetical protein
LGRVDPKNMAIAKAILLRDDIDDYLRIVGGKGGLKEGYS